MIAAHALVLGTWLLAAAVAIGLGRGLLRLFGLPRAGWRALATAFWLGYVAAIGVLQLWHLAWPIDARAVGLLAVLSLPGWWGERPALGGGRPEWVLALGLCVWVANRALGPTALFDTGMYHQPAVAWANAWPAVPGLANLHGRLGFNSGALLVDAALDLGPLDGLALHVANGLLVSVLLIEAVGAAGALRRGSTAAPDAFTVAIAPSVVHAVVRQDVRSLSTDAAVALLLLVTIRAVVSLWESRERRLGDLAVVTLLAAGALVVKLSAAVLAAGLVLVALSACWPALRARPLRAAFLAAPALLLVVGWLVRGVVLSGYPLYPATVAALDVDWRVPLEQARAEAAWVTMSARNLNTNVIYPGWSWVAPWLRGVVVRGDPFAQLTLPVLLVAALLAAAPRGALRSAPWRGTWLALGAGALFWLAAAPHTRMAQGLAWGALGTMVATLAFARPTIRSSLVPAAGALALLLLAKQAVGAAVQASGAPVAAAVDALVTRPKAGAWPAPLPAPTLRAAATADGLPLSVPTEDNACWTVLACTPHPSATLQRRRPGPDHGASLRWGFRQAGDRWEPERWPNPWTPFLTWWRCRQAGRPDCAIA
ncbi:MAG: hypothetical protein JNJ98_03410 [Gemmatimonadetes bacterium]|nr:hypothetical protein [Gemmatimonadota bacterium]